MSDRGPAVDDHDSTSVKTSSPTLQEPSLVERAKPSVTHPLLDAELRVPHDVAQMFRDGAPPGDKLTWQMASVYYEDLIDKEEIRYSPKGMFPEVDAYFENRDERAYFDYRRKWSLQSDRMLAGGDEWGGPASTARPTFDPELGIPTYIAETFRAECHDRGRTATPEAAAAYFEEAIDLMEARHAPKGTFLEVDAYFEQQNLRRVSLGAGIEQTRVPGDRPDQGVGQAPGMSGSQLLQSRNFDRREELQRALKALQNVCEKAYLGHFDKAEKLAIEAFKSPLARTTLGADMLGAILRENREERSLERAALLYAEVLAASDRLANRISKTLEEGNHSTQSLARMLMDGNISVPEVHIANLTEGVQAARRAEAGLMRASRAYVRGHGSQEALHAAAAQAFGFRRALSNQLHATLGVTYLKDITSQPIERGIVSWVGQLWEAGLSNRSIAKALVESVPSLASLGLNWTLGFASRQVVRLALDLAKNVGRELIL